MGNQRTMITISDDDKAWLKTYCRPHNVSMVEAIRRSISCLKTKEAKDTYKAIVNKTRGSWQKEDGLQYQDQMRYEWERSDAHMDKR
jgi:hypothetical protein